MWSSENCKEQTLSIKLRVAPEHCWVWQQQNKEKKRAFLLLGILNSHHCPLFLPTVTRHPPPQTAEQERKQTFSIKPGPVGSANLSEPHSPRWPLIFPGAGSNRLLLQKAITGCQGQEPRRKQSPPPPSPQAPNSDQGCLCPHPISQPDSSTSLLSGLQYLQLTLILHLGQHFPSHVPLLIVSFFHFWSPMAFPSFQQA